MIRHRPQHSVARLVSLGVVQLVEAVGVDINTGGRGDHLFLALLQEMPVGHGVQQACALVRHAHEVHITADLVHIPDNIG